MTGRRFIRSSTGNIYLLAASNSQVSCMLATLRLCPIIKKIIVRGLLFLLFLNFSLDTFGQEKVVNLHGQFLRITLTDTNIKGFKDIGLFFVPTQAKAIDIDLLLNAKSIYYLDLGMSIEYKLDSLRYKKFQPGRLKTVYSPGETFYDSVSIQIAKGSVKVLETKGSFIDKYVLPGQRDFQLLLGNQSFFCRPKTIRTIIDIQ